MKKLKGTNIKVSELKDHFYKLKKKTGKQPYLKAKKGFVTIKFED